MCDCTWFDGDGCRYEDRASGRTEDSYCSFENSGDPTDCDSYRKDTGEDNCEFCGDLHSEDNLEYAQDGDDFEGLACKDCISDNNLNTDY